MNCSGSNEQIDKLTGAIVELGCAYTVTRDEMEAHEISCEHVKETCEKCREEVVRRDRHKHDCVASMLSKFKRRSRYLDEISMIVDELTIHINKQTSTLDRLNTINCEKGKRITEIDRCINLKTKRV